VRAIETLFRLRLKSDQGLFGKAPDWTYHRERQQELARRHPLVARTPDPQPKR
jgi:hypothetical protein